MRLIRYVLIVLILLYCLVCNSQPITYKIKADVKAINVGGIDCFENVPIIWGIYYDTLGIYFLDYSLSYYKTSKRLITEKRKDYRAFKEYAKREASLSKNTIIYLLQDNNDEFYIIRIIADIPNGSYTILITNIEYGLPSYTLHFGNTFYLCN